MGIHGKKEKSRERERERWGREREREREKSLDPLSFSFTQKKVTLFFINDTNCAVCVTVSPKLLS